MMRQSVAMALIGCGLLFVLVATVGIFRFDHVLKRMHAAALVDTLGLLLCMAGVMVLCGFSSHSAKLAMVIVIIWLANPVSSHLIANAALLTDKSIDPENTDEEGELLL